MIDTEKAKPKLPQFERLADIERRLESEIMEADWDGDEVKRVELLRRLQTIRWHMGYGEEYAVPF